MKGVTTLLLCILFISLASATNKHNSGRILQAAQSSSAVEKMCVGLDRTNLVDAKAKADADSSKAAMQSSFKVSGNSLFSASASDPNGIMTGLVTQLPSVQTDLGLFVGPFVLGLVITLLIWPFLCCCCCCPSCCPSKCCQKPENQQYTKCELIWPSITLILALLLMIIASVIGITRAGDIQSSYKTVGCSLAITLDDVINGNTSTAGTYFIGMGNLKTSLQALKTNMSTVTTELTKLDLTSGTSVTGPAHTEGNSLLDTLSKIPNNNIGGSMSAYTYNNFDGSGGTIASTFPTALGTANTASPTNAMNVSYFAIKKVNDGLQTISDQATNFTSQTGSVGGVIDQIVNSMGSMVDTVTGVNTMISGADDTASPIMKIVTIVVTAIFGVFIGLGVLSIIGTILMTFCDKFSCRYLVYFVCVILLVLGFISFLLAVLFSVITPVLYLGCDFITVAIGSSAGFSTNLAPILGGQLSSYLQVCLPGGSGDLLNQIQGVDLSAINGLTDAVSSLRAFDVSILQGIVLTSLNTLSSFIDSYYYTDVLDFVPTSTAADKNFMIKVATPSNYPTCAVNSFSGDNWIPSTRNSDFSCSGTANTASSAQCLNSASIQAGHSAATPTCYGCMDTMKVLLNGAVPADTNARYGNAGGCATWSTDMSNLWTKYYNVKVTNFAPIRTRMTNTITQYNTATTGYHDKLTTVGNSFTTIISNLESIVSSVVNPTTGMIAGLNCLLLGQDINLISNTACTKLFNTFYFLRLSLGIAAFGILFALCCSTCSGVRAFKHSARKGSVLPKQYNQLGQSNGESTFANLNAKP